MLPLVQGQLLSDYDPTSVLDVGLAPRVVDPALLPDMKQVDFVGYIQNPKFRRGAPRGEATKAVAALRNKRLQPQQKEPDR